MKKMRHGYMKRVSGLFFLFVLFCVFLYSKYRQKELDSLFADEKHYGIASAYVIKERHVKSGRQYLIKYKVGNEIIETKLYVGSAPLRSGDSIVIKYLKSEYTEVILADVPENPKDTRMDSTLFFKFWHSLF
jgi:hypothetical protein